MSNTSPNVVSMALQRSPLGTTPDGVLLIGSRYKSRLSAARGTQINSFHPPLTAVHTAYPVPPFLPIFHPPIELASARPRGRLDLDGWIDFAAICLGTVLHLVVGEIHI
jgi:hypothetical protein